jgi:hypothetical protein
LPIVKTRYFQGFADFIGIIFKMPISKKLWMLSTYKPTAEVGTGGVIAAPLLAGSSPSLHPKK